LHTFTGAFTAWEEDRNRRVEGHRLNESEIRKITEAAGRKAIFDKFFSEKKERVGPETMLVFDEAIFSRLLGNFT
jgi:hypothetical protein